MSWPDATELLAPLGQWFDRARRDLPWRARDLDRPHPDPYAVLVSELMLQQTQVTAVIPFFDRWMASFPDVQALAAAESESVHGHWAGLGYYRRARMLHAAARAIADGGWPTEREELARLPGLGPYTAAAVAAIAFQRAEPALDGNAFRVAGRLLALEEPRREAATLRGWLAPALSRFGPSRMVQAIMELGATLCLARAPRCTACPLASACRARALDQVERFPATRPRMRQRVVDLWLVALGDGRGWLLERPGSKGLLAGLWRWPALPPIPAAAGVEQAVGHPGWEQVYTHRIERVTPLLLQVEARFPPGATREWVSVDRLRELPMGRRDQRLRALALAADPAPEAGRFPAAEILAALGGRAGA